MCCLGVSPVPPCGMQHTARRPYSSPDLGRVRGDGDRLARPPPSSPAEAAAAVTAAARAAVAGDGRARGLPGVVEPRPGVAARRTGPKDDGVRTEAGAFWLRREPRPRPGPAPPARTAGDDAADGRAGGVPRRLRAEAPRESAAPRPADPGVNPGMAAGEVARGAERGVRSPTEGGPWAEGGPCAEGGPWACDGAGVAGGRS